MTRVAIVGTAGVPARYGGFETLAACLCEQLVDSDVDLAVYCSSKQYPEKEASYHRAELRYVPFGANGWQSIVYDAISILHALVKGTDAILLLGVSGAVALPLVRFASSVNVVTNVDGIESRRAKWGFGTRRLLRFLEWLAIRCSHTVIADNQGIHEYLVETYGTSAEIIAYGGDHVAPDGSESVPLEEAPYALMIARIEPENNIETVLQAFDSADLAERLTLVAIGNWDGSDYGRRLKTRFAGRPGYRLLDPIYERDRIRRLRAHASLYIHGHSAGGTNPSLVEAMFFPVPIVAFDCNFNRYTMTNRGSYFTSADQLRELIRRQACGDVPGDAQSVVDFAWQRYTWERVSKAYLAVLTKTSDRSRRSAG